MKLNPWTIIGISAVSTCAVAAFTENSVANSLSPFSWTMEWRLVNGRTNKRFHVLDSGTLTLSGKLWIYEKRRGGPSQPMRIKVEVVKENNDDKDNNEKDAFCSVIVTPSKTLNEPTEYSKSCGRVEAGKYWVRINKFEASSTDGDGWHNRGNGTLVTE